MPDEQPETAPLARSVWILTRPMPLPEFWRDTPALALQPFWASLVSHLTADKLEAVMHLPTEAGHSLGAVWEADGAHRETFRIRVKRDFCIRENSDTPISMEYCGRTFMSDETIMQKGTHIGAKYLIYSSPDHKSLPRI
jgi:hypothetical protein